MGQKSKKNKQTKAKGDFDKYKDQFNSEEDRIGYTATLIVAFCAGIYACFHINKFVALFYSPGAPTWRNIFQFCSLMACCWLFGLFLSKTISFGLKLGKSRNKRND